ncbi:MAG: hypothetical protein EZS28_034636 [Streblomastix strix]|uniref:Uncharacterized protein n=1 Tax=Streblomastix strix TaxID=222440 RepID=A0A5J4UHE0_9EUKA|nr:MAG: hypothetical protein EZS28_034636 [Streblomastix strix]
MKSPTIPEVQPQFEKEIEVVVAMVSVALQINAFQHPFQQPFEQQVFRCETPILSARCRSSTFEETLTPDSSMCRWLLDIISEDEHMIKESALFVLSENQLIRVVAYTFDDPESQVQLSIEDVGCCEDDALLLLKADKTELIDAYSKTEDDELLALKLNISDQIDAYNKSEVDELLDDKLNITDQIDAYSKIEDNVMLQCKAGKSELDYYVDLTSARTITGQKQFNSNVCAAAFAKTGKNDASILPAGGGDMLVSSLVSQPQLQEVRDIASGKSKGYVFATTDEMNTWMEDQENVAKLAIGDNLYIVDKYVMDYWWDDTGLRALETELPDMSNVITILGTAT